MVVDSDIISENKISHFSLVLSVSCLPGRKTPFNIL